MSEAPRPVGGQTVRTPEIDEDILQSLSEGWPLRRICARLGVGTSTVRDWVRADPAFAAEYERARARGFEAMAEDCLEIADETGNDVRYVSDGDGGEREVVNSEVIQRSKLRIETRLKLLACWDPKRYSPRMQLQGGGDDAPPIRTEGTLHLDPANVRDIMKTLADEC